MKRPNVVIIYTDQQRWDTINQAGFEYMHTPNLDKLSKNGVIFNKSFCNNTVCMPSRQSFLTGLYPSNTGCENNGIEFNEKLTTAPQYFKQYGYTTGNIGKLHFKNHSNRNHKEPYPKYGFDVAIISDEPGCYDDAYIKWVEAKDKDQVEKCRCSTPPICEGEVLDLEPRNTNEPYIFRGNDDLTHSAFVAEETNEFIENNKDNPFFVVAGFYSPHTPVNPPKKCLDFYQDDDKIPDPKMNIEDNENLNLSIKEWKNIRKHYYALITHVDEQVGKIIKKVEDLGLSDNTIFVFTADHGEHLGDHGQIQKGPFGYDSCARVPLIISYPNQKVTGIRNELVEAIDVLPTLLDLCSIQIPPILQGKTIKPLLDNDTYQERTSILMEHKDPFVKTWRTIRTQEAKYAVNNHGEEFLFNLKVDPFELKPITNDEKLLTTMRKELIDKMLDSTLQYPVKTGQY